MSLFPSNAWLNRVFAFVHQDGAERRLLLRILLALWAARLGLWLFPLGRLQKLLERSKNAPIGSIRPVDVARRIDRLSIFVPRCTCLVRALAARRILAECGFASELCIGVVKDGDRLRAHAWLRTGGDVLVGGVANLRNFKVLERAQLKGCEPTDHFIQEAP